jgi:hypothetical protein
MNDSTKFTSYKPRLAENLLSGGLVCGAFFGLESFISDNIIRFYELECVAITMCKVGEKRWHKEPDIFNGHMDLYLIELEEKERDIEKVLDLINS